MDGLLERIIVESIMGLQNGMILALVATGFTLILGVMNIVNFSHGEFYMLGAFVGWLVLTAVAPFVGFWGAVLAAGLLVAAFGLVIERGVFQSTHGGSPFTALLVSFGLALVLQQAALATFGTIGKYIEPPIKSSLPFFGLQFPVYRLVIMVVAALFIILLLLFMNKSKWGVWIRATIQDREMAACMGVPVPRVYQLVFALGCGLAAMSGVLVAPIFSVSYSMGLDIIVQAFIVVVVGGLGSLTGTLIAAFLIGELDALGSIFLEGSQPQILSLVVLMIFLMFRPQGLMGERGLE
ncbi:MAG: branched-chain amino acid ABC transporter permease [Rhizobiaceae bacterium]